MGEGAQGGVLPLAGDIIAGSSALAGFILVYLSALATAYAGYDRTARAAVRGIFRPRAWFAAIGILFAILSCATAVIAKWQGSDEVAGISFLLFLATLFLAALAAIFMALEIE